MRAAMDSPCIGVSACLLGHAVRFDGGHKRDRFIIELLAPFVRWAPLCPELEVGMGCPREPVRLVQGEAGEVRMRATRSGADWTERMRGHARARADRLGHLDGCILKSGSPTCGMERVKLYHDDGRASRDGVGLFYAALARRWPNLPVEEEGRLNDPGLRASFLERVFVYQRLRRLWASGWRIGDLVAFHTAHKMAVLAHDPEGYRGLGRLVAGARALPRDELQARYEGALMAALSRPSRPGRQANVLLHLAGHLKGRLSPEDGRELRAAIEDHRRGVVPLVVPLTLLRHHVRRLGARYVAAQSYLEPHPPALAVRAW
jgi:uncharacterized protein YbgA (DUF1722 family)/uncharacterized protein YbbK (DUF523 family)